VSARFLDIARDPQIIPGVHHYCDEWCDYCRVTTRCLLFRCTALHRKSQGLSDSDPSFATFAEAASFTRAVSAAEGLRTDELDALLSHPPGESGIETSDPLADMAWEYAERIATMIGPVALQWAKEARTVSGDGPSAAETVLYYQLRIYMRVFRALVARERHAGGAQSEEARGCAKVALISIDRSLDALSRLADAFSTDDLRDLRELLGRLRDGLEARVPAARGYVRIGLDAPAAVS